MNRKKEKATSKTITQIIKNKKKKEKDNDNNKLSRVV